MKPFAGQILEGVRGLVAEGLCTKIFLLQQDTKCGEEDGKDWCRIFYRAQVDPMIIDLTKFCAVTKVDRFSTHASSGIFLINMGL